MIFCVSASNSTAAHKKSSRSCSSVANTCPDNIVGVDPGNDPTDNFMSYASDSCQHVFSDGQVERMVAMYEYFRFDPSAVSPEPTTFPTDAPTHEPTNSPTVGPTGEPAGKPR